MSHGRIVELTRNLQRNGSITMKKRVSGASRPEAGRGCIPQHVKILLINQDLDRAGAPGELEPSPLVLAGKSHLL